MLQDFLTKPVKTPCVGVCSTGIGDSVCRGCKRFAHEVINWNRYSNDEKRLIMGRLETFLVQVVNNYLQVQNQARLLEQMRLQQLRFRPEQPPQCWVFDLLRAGASQINDWQNFGLRLLPAAVGLSSAELRERIDSDYYTLSCAHYERYILPGLDQHAL